MEVTLYFCGMEAYSNCALQWNDLMLQEGIKACKNELDPVLLLQRSSLSH